MFYDYRKVVFKGVPKETGRFTIRVSLYVEAIDECYFDDFAGTEVCHNPLCTNDTSKLYTLVVR